MVKIEGDYYEKHQIYRRLYGYVARDTSGVNFRTHRLNSVFFLLLSKISNLRRMFPFVARFCASAHHHELLKLFN